MKFFAILLTLKKPLFDGRASAEYKDFHCKSTSISTNTNTSIK